MKGKEKKIKYSWSYNGLIEISDGYIFNHGTESNKGERVKSHIKNCKENDLEYKILDNKQDRIVAQRTKMIKPSADKLFVTKVCEHINKYCLSETNGKATLLKNYLDVLHSSKSSTKRGLYDDIKKCNLSETECCYIPNSVSENDINKAAKWVEDNWYYKDPNIRENIKNYVEYTNEDTTKDKTNQVKPIPIYFGEVIKNEYFKISCVKNAKIIRIQGIKLAYNLKDHFHKAPKIQVLYREDEIKKCEEEYRILKRDKRVEFLLYNSNIEAKEFLENMEIKPDLIIMNPPYDGNLHLQILENVLKEKERQKLNTTIISIQPVRWLIDPLRKYKNNADYSKYEESIADKISNLKIIDVEDVNNIFNIKTDLDLGIYLFDNTYNNISLYNPIVDSIVEKIQLKLKEISSLYQNCEINTDKDKLKSEEALVNAVSGYRCEIKGMCSGRGGCNDRQRPSSKKAEVNIVLGPYKDGFVKDGKFFSETRQKNQHSKNYFPYSIKFNNLEEADNFYLTCNTPFYKRLVQFYKTNTHVPIEYLPYLNPKKAWTNKELCDYFNLTKEESDFMCNYADNFDEYDYSYKDFINYYKL